ncbi:MULTISPECIES: hypothetical protein [Corallococcus]|nr:MULTISPECIES: hypothetical protein [Corallococcus]NRD54757.1 hypothetical protein [Corallococcus exiguus]
MPRHASDGALRALAKGPEPFLYKDRDHGVRPEETFMHPWLRRLCR